VANGDLLDLLLYLGISTDRGVGGSSGGIAGADNWLKDMVAHSGCMVHRIAVVDSVGQVVTEGPLIARLS